MMLPFAPLAVRARIGLTVLCLGAHGADLEIGCGTIRVNAEIFDRAVARSIVPERIICRWQADWYHQFILAGAYRRLQNGPAGRGPRGAAAVRAAGRARPGRVAEVAALRAASTAATAGARPKAG